MWGWEFPRLMSLVLVRGCGWAAVSNALLTAVKVVDGVLDSVCVGLVVGVDEGEMPALVVHVTEGVVVHVGVAVELELGLLVMDEVCVGDRVGLDVGLGVGLALAVHVAVCFISWCGRCTLWSPAIGWCSPPVLRPSRAGSRCCVSCTCRRMPLVEMTLSWSSHWSPVARAASCSGGKRMAVLRAAS